MEEVKEAWQILGTIGDFIGGALGTALSLFGFFVVYLSYLTQREELKETLQSLKKQSFENKFFILLEHWNNFRYNLSHENKDQQREEKGFRYFEHLVNAKFQELKRSHQTEKATFESLFNHYYNVLHFYMSQLE